MRRRSQKRGENSERFLKTEFGHGNRAPVPHIHSKKVHVEAADRPNISSDPSPIQRSVPSPTERREEDVKQPARRIDGQPVAVYIYLHPYLHTDVRPTSPHDPHLKQ